MRAFVVRSICGVVVASVLVHGRRNANVTMIAAVGCLCLSPQAISSPAASLAKEVETLTSPLYQLRTGLNLPRRILLVRRPVESHHLPPVSWEGWGRRAAAGDRVLTMSGQSVLRAPLQGLSRSAVVVISDLGGLMTDDFKLYVGVDWATEEHEVCAQDAHGKKVDTRSFKHSGDGLAGLTTWLCTKADPTRLQSRLRCRIDLPPRKWTA